MASDVLSFIWVHTCKMCDKESMGTILSLKQGDSITFELERDYPYSGRKTKTISKKVIEDPRGILIAKGYSNCSVLSLFENGKIVEVRKTLK
mgnify:CR=1 FL=1|tara:strand:- start:153 stop:428 length:276 start_codon:yes stop_codon:yes gene_type:complete